MDSDRIRWDERYADHDLAVPRVPEVLEAHPALVDELPAAGRALDIACGTGAQALWLAGRGFDVVALDVSVRAIELAVAAATAHGLDGRIDARVHDADHGFPGDLGRFDVVVCQRFRDPSLYRSIVDALTPGGIGIVTVLSAAGLDGEPGEFHAPRGELGGAFAGPAAEILLDEEGDGVASIVVRRR